MISIIYTNETIESEPGPNFYWRGKPLDFLQLVFDLHVLGKDNDIEMDLDQFDYIQVKGEYSVKANSSNNGKTLCAISDNAISINLNNDLWRQILVMLLSISYYPSHNYIEFDNQLVESANFIISSEG